VSGRLAGTLKPAKAILVAQTDVTLRSPQFAVIYPQLPEKVIRACLIPKIYSNYQSNDVLPRPCRSILKYERGELVVTSGGRVQDNGHSLTRVLIVDDEPRILRFVSLSLVAEGYEVMTASSGSQALELVTSQQPDIMVLDIKMPRMNGFQVLEKLRSFSRMPVIAFSTESFFSRKALDVGANDFLEKPFMPEYLVGKIETVLGHKGNGHGGTGAG
jgi:CheY-like chemotaxis protein